MRVEKVYLTGTHPNAFRAGEPAEVMGVKMCTPFNDRGLISMPLEPRICYHIIFSDGAEDFIPKSDVDHGVWKFSTLSELIRYGAPEVE